MYNKKRDGYIAASQSVDKPQVLFLRRLRRIYVFSLTRAAKKHLVSEKPLIQRFFKGTGVVLAGIECSPKISDFRANGIPVQERVDFFDTLRDGYIAASFFIPSAPREKIRNTKKERIAARLTPVSPAGSVGASASQRCPPDTHTAMTVFSANFI